MRATLLAALLAFLAAPLPLAAEDAAEAVARLTPELGSDDPARRDAALTGLIRLREGGERALARLEAVFEKEQDARVRVAIGGSLKELRR